MMVLRQWSKVFLVSLSIAVLASCANPKKIERESRTQETVQRRIAAGMEYLHLDQLREARQHFTKALDRDPSSAAAHNAMALLYKSEGDPEREEKHYRKALRGDRNYIPARNNYGILLYEKGDYKAAAKQFQRAVNDARYSGRGGAFENLARSEMKLGNNDKAISAFERALRLGRNEEQIIPDLVVLQCKEQRYSMADRYFQEYLNNHDNEVTTAGMLWAGICVSAAKGDAQQRRTYEARLQKEFPQSSEYKEWRQWQKSNLNKD